ncbi:MAG: oxygen-independent coproporphyrinogen III oxidase [Halobacteriovoraceae bacterium]|nr:oxygen-independent coproporphyrinogen III oxidase [Halobacteriovoraceae bacterium]|tara:strand:+ start:296108 stop:297442 length:1335 start_codon:yes stop_codon:yes gene_type:complete
MTKIYQKYDIKAPRYTSYPAMPYWNNKLESKGWFKYLKKGFESNNEVDLYIHIPYCQKLCWYCGCNRVISKNKDKGAEYVDLIIKEFQIYINNLPDLVVRSLHFGGGTPNFLEPQTLDLLLSKISPWFHKEHFEGAIEIDPRTVKVDHLAVLAKYGFKKLSLGIQDFNLEVQEAINRVQPFDLVKNVVQTSRALGFEQINFDLIWGLPKQTNETVKETIRLTSELGPDQISYYSYAHLPQKFKHQKLIKESDILKGKSKRDLYETGKVDLEASGYVEIGMDHYAKLNSPLHLALKERKLKRNFMGYTPKKSPTLIGLGASSISSNQYGFMQNHKELTTYREAVENGLLPMEKGHSNSTQDTMRNNLIQNLMCNLILSESDIEKLGEHGEIKNKLREFERDGLLTRGPGKWVATESGRKFLRCIALAFDEYFPSVKQGNMFSQSV